MLSIDRLQKLEKYNKKTSIYDLSTCIELNNEYDVDMVIKKINR